MQRVEGLIEKEESLMFVSHFAEHLRAPGDLKAPLLLLSLPIFLVRKHLALSRRLHLHFWEFLFVGKCASWFYWVQVSSSVSSFQRVMSLELPIVSWLLQDEIPALFPQHLTHSGLPSWEGFQFLAAVVVETQIKSPTVWLSSIYLK